MSIMYNILIVEDNIALLHSLINVISQELPNVRINCISSTGKETLTILKNHSIDIIILDLTLNDDVTGFDIINYIDSNNLVQYKNSIIIYTGNLQSLSILRNNPYVYTYISKINGMEILIKNINELIIKCKKNLNKQNILEKIINELKLLHFNFSYNGTKYFLECIYEIYLTSDYNNINLKGNIYPIIAKRYNKSVNNIKSNITQSYIRMCNSCSISYLEKYTNLYLGKEHPKIKDLIQCILRKL